MSSQKPTAKTKPANKQFRGYANYEPTQKEKVLIKNAPCEPHDVYGYLDALLEEGYRVTVSFDDFNQTWQATVSTVDKSHDNAGIFLVCRGSTWQKAVRQASWATGALTENNIPWERLLVKQKPDLDD